MNSHLSKRQFMLGGCCGALATAAIAATPAVAQSDTSVASAHKPMPKGISPDEALAELKKGNDAFMSDAPQHASIDRLRRLEIAKEQHPFAVLVGCSDSRVSPEHLFGRGLGDLFIVRVAGNTVDQTALGSIEYAIEHLSVPLIVVLGHERCGAVKAAISVIEENTTFDSAMNAMVEPILPAVLKARSKDGDLLDNAVKENALRVAKGLESSGTIIGEKLKAGKLKIVAAYYDLDNGKVEFI